MLEKEKVIQFASSGTAEELKLLVHHPSSEVISRAIRNSNLTEDLILIIANRKNIHPEILESIFNDDRWKQSYRIMRALCKNPKTPQKITLSLIKSLRILDIADLSRNNNIALNVRMRAEAHINEKILTMSLGIKLSLAKRASSAIVIRLIEDGMREVVASCLDSPYITESDLLEIIRKKKTSSHIICQIAKHLKWSRRYQIQWSLICNDHTPLFYVVNFLKNMKLVDLRELYNSPQVPSSSKPFIHKELFDREFSESVDS